MNNFFTNNLDDSEAQFKGNATYFKEDENTPRNQKLKSDLEEQRILLNKGLNRILIRHRNSMIFLIVMTGPFLIVFQTVKYIIKYGGLYLFYLYGKQ